MSINKLNSGETLICKAGVAGLALANYGFTTGSSGTAGNWYAVMTTTSDILITSVTLCTQIATGNAHLRPPINVTAQLGMGSAGSESAIHAFNFSNFYNCPPTSPTTINATYMYGAIGGTTDLAIPIRVQSGVRLAIKGWASASVDSAFSAYGNITYVPISSTTKL